MNPKCLGNSLPDTFDAKSADFTGLKMRRITRAVSFDHLVGDREQRRGHTQAQCVGDLEVDRQLELGRCLHGQIGSLGTPEDAVDILRGARKRFTAKYLFVDTKTV